MSSPLAMSTLSTLSMLSDGKRGVPPDSKDQVTLRHGSNFHVDRRVPESGLRRAQHIGASSDGRQGPQTVVQSEAYISPTLSGEASMRYIHLQVVAVDAVPNSRFEACPLVQVSAEGNSLHEHQEECPSWISSCECEARDTQVVTAPTEGVPELEEIVEPGAHVRSQVCVHTEVHKAALHSRSTGRHTDPLSFGTRTALGATTQLFSTDSMDTFVECSGDFHGRWASDSSTKGGKFSGASVEASHSCESVTSGNMGGDLSVGVCVSSGEMGTEGPQLRDVASSTRSITEAQKERMRYAARRRRASPAMPSKSQSCSMLSTSNMHDLVSSRSSTAMSSTNLCALPAVPPLRYAGAAFPPLPSFSRATSPADDAGRDQSRSVCCGSAGLPAPEVLLNGLHPTGPSFTPSFSTGCMPSHPTNRLSALRELFPCFPELLYLPMDRLRVLQDNGKELGRGSFGVVYLGELYPPGVSAPVCQSSQVNSASHRSAPESPRLGATLRGLCSSSIHSRVMTVVSETLGNSIHLPLHQQPYNHATASFYNSGVAYSASGRNNCSLSHSRGLGDSGHSIFERSLPATPTGRRDLRFSTCRATNSDAHLDGMQGLNIQLANKLERAGDAKEHKSSPSCSALLYTTPHSVFATGTMDSSTSTMSVEEYSVQQTMSPHSPLFARRDEGGVDGVAGESLVGGGSSFEGGGTQCVADDYTHPGRPMSDSGQSTRSDDSWEAGGKDPVNEAERFEETIRTVLRISLQDEETDVSSSSRSSQSSEGNHLHGRACWPLAARQQVSHPHPCVSGALSSLTLTNLSSPMVEKSFSLLSGPGPTPYKTSARPLLSGQARQLPVWQLFGGKEGSRGSYATPSREVAARPVTKEEGLSDGARCTSYPWRSPVGESCSRASDEVAESEKPSTDSLLPVGDEDFSATLKQVINSLRNEVINDLGGGDRGRGGIFSDAEDGMAKDAKCDVNGSGALHSFAGNGHLVSNGDGSNAYHGQLLSSVNSRNDSMLSEDDTRDARTQAVWTLGKLHAGTLGDLSMPSGDEYDDEDRVFDSPPGFCPRAATTTNGSIPFRPVAVKVICKTDLARADFYRTFESEVRFSSYLHHPCIINTFGIAEDDQDVYLVMDLAENGTVEDYAKRFGREEMQVMAPRFLADVVLALEYFSDASLHPRLETSALPSGLPPKHDATCPISTASADECLASGKMLTAEPQNGLLDTLSASSRHFTSIPTLNDGMSCSGHSATLEQEPYPNIVVHRDIKPENLLLTWDYHVKIGDFGTACFIGDADANRFAGTVSYMPPEMIQDNKTSPSSDLWALGCMLYELLDGTHPFHSFTPYLTMQKIKTFDPGTLTFSTAFSDEAKDLVTKLLQPDPTRRLGSAACGGFAVLKRHPFFAQIDWDSVLDTPNISATNTDYTAELADFLASGERLVYCSPVIESPHHGRPASPAPPAKVMVLTEAPRLFLIDPATNRITKVILWQSTLRVEVRSVKYFTVHCGSTQVYHFQDKNCRADLWGLQVNKLALRHPGPLPQASKHPQGESSSTPAHSGDACGGIHRDTSHTDFSRGATSSELGGEPSQSVVHSGSSMTSMEVGACRAWRKISPRHQGTARGVRVQTASAMASLCATEWCEREVTTTHTPWAGNDSLSKKTVLIEMGTPLEECASACGLSTESRIRPDGSSQVASSTRGGQPSDGRFGTPEARFCSFETSLRSDHSRVASDCTASTESPVHPRLRSKRLPLLALAKRVFQRARGRKADGHEGSQLGSCGGSFPPS